MNEPKKPLPKPLQWLLLLGLLALIGVPLYLLRPGTGPCTTKTFSKQGVGGTCLLEGTVQEIDEVNRRMNALAIGGTPLEQFMLVDAAGSTTIFFDPAKFPAPKNGAHVKIRAGIVEQKVNGAPRLVVRELVVR
jgi:hypothetical protein